MSIRKNGMFGKLIGDRQFYRKVLMISIPIMIQNGITNFVNLLDNIMIGRVGTVQMSGAAIVNQLLFVYNLCIFGALSGAGIFTAQYYGQGDQEGVRKTFRFKLWITTILTLGTVVLFLAAGPALIGIYLKGEGTPEDAAAILHYGQLYMRLMLVGLPAFMISQTYADTLRECGETMLPMKAGLISIFVNLIFNYLLIYGKLGLPAMGVAGAAAATVLARYVEALIIVVIAHRSAAEDSFLRGLYRTMRVPGELCLRIVIKGT
ncbi:MAG: MATE family efflux transporter, partial [Lachnospiraceae bacterium]|nr:MATE family efflux transporter [Lachnospiraceae bacterium]